MSDFAQRIEPYQGVILAIYGLLFLAGCAVLLTVTRKRLAAAAEDWCGIVLRASCRPWNWTDLSAIIALILGLSCTAALIMRGRTSPGDFIPLAVSMALTHGTILAAVLLIARFRRVRLRSAFGGGSDRFLQDLRAGFAGYLSMIVLVCPAMIATAVILKLAGHEPEPQAILGLFAMQKSVFAKIYLSIWAVLVAPLAEEILFRGILLPLLLRILPSVWSIALVSIGFAALHGDLTAFLPLIVVSISLSLAYLVTESLVVSVTMHALFNSVTMSVLLLTG